MKTRFAFLVSIFLVLIISLFIFAGCGFKAPLDTKEIVISGPASLTVTNEAATGIYSAVVFNGVLAEDRGDKFTTEPKGNYWWYLLKDNKILSTEVDGNTHTFKFYIAGSYQITVSVGAALKTNGIINGIIPVVQFYDVNIAKGAGYRETAITPRFTIEEWYPGFITVDASRTTTSPITDKVVGWEWYLDGSNFSSQQQAGVAVTEGTHKIRLEIKTLFGFSQYLETDYVYKSGAASVEVKGSTGGSATGGTSGTINQPVVDNNPVVIDDGNIPKPVEGRDGNFDLSFNKGQEIQANRGGEVRVPIYGQGLCDKINVTGIYFDPALLTLQSIESAGTWKVVQKSGANFSATCTSPDAGAVVICYLIFKATNNTGISGLTWPVNMTGCSAGYNNRGLFLRGIDGSVRVK